MLDALFSNKNGPFRKTMRLYNVLLCCKVHKADAQAYLFINIKPLYTDFFHLVGYNEFGMIHCTYQGVTGWVCVCGGGGGCEQQSRRPACAFAQSDQHLCYLLIGKYHT